MPIAYETKPNHFRLDSPLVVNVKDGTPLVLVPAGEFEMGDGQDKTRTVRNTRSTWARITSAFIA